MFSSNFIQNLIIQIPPLLFALTFHELAHGYVAYSLGDHTAKDEGRLTLNPLKHLDPIGTLAFIVMKIGWAKPIPVNPANLRNPHKDMLFVSLAGPGANIVLAIISAILVKILFLFPVLPSFIFNPLANMLVASVWINVVLAVFNCVPIPPLDGSKILMGLLPQDLAYSYANLEPYGFILVLILFATGIIQKVIFPIIQFTNRLLLG